MKKVFPVDKGINYAGNVKKTYLAGLEAEAFSSLWPVYAPYEIYEIEETGLVRNLDDRIEIDKKTGLKIRYCREFSTIKSGEWVIQGQKKDYWKVWTARGTKPEGVKFINPAEEMGLLKDFLSVDIKDTASILNFVNRYGLLGATIKVREHSVQTSSWAAVSPGVIAEDLWDFQLVTFDLQQTYKLWKSRKDTATVLERLCSGLSGITEYPQLNSNGDIAPGKRGKLLLHYIWLHFYNLVLGGDWRECAFCGNLFEMEHGHQRYCPDCRESPTPPGKKLRRQREREARQ